MSSRPKILCLSGSLRKDSLNKKLVKAAMAAAQEAGADCTFIDLKDYPMPIYDGDIEAESGIPENGKKLKKLLKEHHALLIASPEYNHSNSLSKVFLRFDSVFSSIAKRLDFCSNQLL